MRKGPKKASRVKGPDLLNESRKRLRILLVEDNDINKMVIERFLAKLGYVCDHASNGRIGVDMALEKQYDLVLMDMQMPVMDGLEASKIIIEKLKKNAPFIVALTANAFKSDREKCFDAGMCYFLEKPLRKNHLIMMFDEVFGEKNEKVS
jgi:CheY-like chemotaxis protein